MNVSGSFPGVLKKMKDLVQRHCMPDRPNISDGELLGILVTDRLKSLPELKIAWHSMRNSLTFNISEARKRAYALRDYEIELHKTDTGQLTFTAKQLVQIQVKVDLKRVKLPCEFNVYAFRKFFRELEDDPSFHDEEKQRIVQVLHDSLIVFEKEKERLKVQFFSKSWPTRRRLVTMGVLSDNDFEPVVLFQHLARVIRPHMFEYIAPRIQQFLHDVRGRYMIYNMNFDKLSDCVGHVPCFFVRKEPLRRGMRPRRSTASAAARRLLSKKE